MNEIADKDVQTIADFVGVLPSQVRAVEYFLRTEMAGVDLPAEVEPERRCIMGGPIDPALHCLREALEGELVCEACAASNADPDAPGCDCVNCNRPFLPEEWAEREAGVLARGQIIGGDFGRPDRTVMYVAVPTDTPIGKWRVSVRVEATP